MKKVLLLLVASALLVTLGLAQTPDAASNTDPANVKGCLGGSDGNYTIAEDGSRQIFKITTSSVDLKPHLGHDVKLTGHKAIAAVNSGSTDKSFAVTELTMISEHCALAAAAPAAATVIPPSETVITPTADTAAASSAAASTPVAGPAAPAVAVSPDSATVTTPAAEPAAPATVAPSSAVSALPRTTHHTRDPRRDYSVFPARRASGTGCDNRHVFSDRQHGRRRTFSPDETVSPLSQTRGSASCSRINQQSFFGIASPPAAEATTPAPTAKKSSDTVSPAEADAATAGPSSATAPAPDAAAAPAPAVTHRAGSLSLLIAFVVLVIVLGTTAPLISRWRKKRTLEREGSPNLSFSNEVSTNEPNTKEVRMEVRNETSSYQDKSEPRKVA